MQIPADKPGDGPEKKITRLAIGIEGGFDANSGKKFRYEEFYKIVILPDFSQIQWPNTKLHEIVIKHCLTSFRVFFLFFFCR